MPVPFLPVIHRLRVTPDPATDGPPPVEGGRPKGSRRPHTNVKAAQVRRLIEQTTLTYSEIAAKTGVGRASICRWARDGAWQRPLFAPRATDTVPSARAGQKLKLRKLAERLRLLAERAVGELEAAPNVDLDRLRQALEVMKMARLEAQGRRRRRPRVLMIGEPRTGRQTLTQNEAIRAALKEMRRGGVDLAHIPQEALDLVIDAHEPVDDHMMLKPPRGAKGRR